MLPGNRLIQFKESPGAEHIKLPNPEFLDVHYRLAEILNAAGIGERIDQLIQEFDKLLFFLDDGPPTRLGC
jgi:hypothetical protein